MRPALPAAAVGFVQRVYAVVAPSPRVARHLCQLPTGSALYGCARQVGGRCVGLALPSPRPLAPGRQRPRPDQHEPQPEGSDWIQRELPDR